MGSFGGLYDLGHSSLLAKEVRSVDPEPLNPPRYMGMRSSGFFQSQFSQNPCY